jgi:hypothetical protein
MNYQTPITDPKDTTLKTSSRMISSNEESNEYDLELICEGERTTLVDR